MISWDRYWWVGFTEEVLTFLKWGFIFFNYFSKKCLVDLAKVIPIANENRFFLCELTKLSAYFCSIRRSIAGFGDVFASILWLSDSLLSNRIVLGDWASRKKLFLILAIYRSLKYCTIRHPILKWCSPIAIGFYGIPQHYPLAYSNQWSPPPQ